MPDDIPPHWHGMVYVHYAFPLPEETWATLMKDLPTPVDQEDDSWVIVLEQRIKDGLPDLLTHARDDPDVEIL